MCFIYKQYGAHLHDNNNKMSQKISIKLFNVSSVSTRSSALNFRCQVISNWIRNIKSVGLDLKSVFGDMEAHEVWILVIIEWDKGGLACSLRFDSWFEIYRETYLKLFNRTIS